MVKITWKGEGEPPKEGEPEQEVTLGHYKMKRGEAVEITEAPLIEMCRENKFFEVEGEPKAPSAAEESHSVSHARPSGRK
jgi:hypothetical protein